MEFNADDAARLGITEGDLVGWNMGLPVSSTHSRSAGSATLCTDTNARASSSADGLFHS
ncbi:hypothetical protein [Micromonospora citrea]|uniref:hypothetical protein n=1 Tax=Micromonospora citrea TaxID=47855 RepID=UPI001FDEDF3D|nr:hypothetical protein [Micromonospora citrea]